MRQANILENTMRPAKRKQEARQKTKKIGRITQWPIWSLFKEQEYFGAEPVKGDDYYDNPKQVDAESMVAVISLFRR